MESQLLLMKWKEFDSDSIIYWFPCSAATRQLRRNTCSTRTGLDC